MLGHGRFFLEPRPPAAVGRNRGGKTDSNHVRRNHGCSQRLVDRFSRVSVTLFGSGCRNRSESGSGSRRGGATDFEPGTM